MNRSSFRSLRAAAAVGAAAALVAFAAAACDDPAGAATGVLGAPASATSTPSPSSPSPSATASSDGGGTAGLPQPTTGGGGAGGAPLGGSATSLDQAAQIALAHVGGGTVVRTENEFEHGRQVWRFDIATGSGIRRVDVDQATGAVVRDEARDDRGGRGRGGDDDRGGHGRGSDDGPGDDHGSHGRDD